MMMKFAHFNFFLFFFGYGISEVKLNGEMGIVFGEFSIHRGMIVYYVRISDGFLSAIACYKNHS